MPVKNENDAINKQGRRTLLTAGSVMAITGAVQHWSKPVVESVVLPAHAVTTDPPVITSFGFADSSTSCISPPTPSSTNFTLAYSFTSTFGVVSHAITASCGDDTITIVDGNQPLGANLLPPANTENSFQLSGDEFGGDVDICCNNVMGPAPLTCDITITLIDANGSPSSDTISLEQCNGD